MYTNICTVHQADSNEVHASFKVYFDPTKRTNRMRECVLSSKNRIHYRIMCVYTHLRYQLYLSSYISENFHLQRFFFLTSFAQSNLCCCQTSAENWMAQRFIQTMCWNSLGTWFLVQSTTAKTFLKMTISRTHTITLTSAIQAGQYTEQSISITISAPSYKS